MKFEIRSRWSGLAMFSLETESLRLCVEAAVRQRVDLCGANLCGVDLCGVDLRGANLCGVDLCGANLYGVDLCGEGEEAVKAQGDRPLLTVGPLGSRADTLYAWMTNKGVYLRTGCFWGTIDEFVKSLARTHGGEGPYCEEYLDALVLIRGHAARWNKENSKEGINVATS